MPLATSSSSVGDCIAFEVSACALGDDEDEDRGRRSSVFNLSQVLGGISLTSEMYNMRLSNAKARQTSGLVSAALLGEVDLGLSKYMP